MDKVMAMHPLMFPMENPKEKFPRTIMIYHEIKGIGETIAVDFDAGSRGRIGRLSPSGLYVRNIAGRDESERVGFVKSYLEKSLGSVPTREVIDAALTRTQLEKVYENQKEKGRVVTGIVSVLPLERVCTYKNK